MGGRMLEGFFCLLWLVACCRCFLYELQLSAPRGVPLHNFSLDLGSMHMRLFNGSNSIEYTLVRNTGLFNRRYRETTFDGHTLKQHHSNSDFHRCYYDSVKRPRDPESFALVNFCQGRLSGMLHVGGKMHSVEEGERGVEVELMLNSPKINCSRLHKNVLEIHKLKRQKRRKKHYQDFTNEKHVIAFYVIIDFSVWERECDNLEDCLKETRATMQFANRLFQGLGLSLGLTGVEVWKSFHFSVQRSQPIFEIRDYIMQHVAYRLPAWDYIGFRLSRDKDETLGSAVISAGCNLFYNSLVWWQESLMGKNPKDKQVKRQSIRFQASTIVHELVHTFGVEHDEEYGYCPCTDPTFICIMSTIAGSDSTVFSECTQRVVRKQFRYNRNFCFANAVPYADGFAACGNGILEAEEACDCGGFSEQICNSSCCNKATCTLVNGATCASGLCCDVTTCQLKPQNHQCRPAKGSCDVEEVCDGSHQLCPSDQWHFDGKLCEGGFYCFDGSCMHDDTNCHMIFGPDAKDANEKCHEQMSQVECHLGRLCRERDRKCGVALCETPESKHPVFQVFKKKEIGCTGLVIHSPKYNSNPAYAFNGRKCGRNMMCFERNCISRQYILMGHHKKYYDPNPSSNPETTSPSPSPPPPCSFLLFLLLNFLLFWFFIH